MPANSHITSESLIKVKEEYVVPLSSLQKDYLPLTSNVQSYESDSDSNLTAQTQIKNVESKIIQEDNLKKRSRKS